MSDAPMTAAQQKSQAEAAARAQLNEEAEYVMNNSRPTPSQAEVDAIKTGAMSVDDKEDPDNPEMPHLMEQQHRIATAAGDAPVYRTREARADPLHESAYPQHRRLQRAMDENPPPPAAKDDDDDAPKTPPPSPGAPASPTAPARPPATPTAPATPPAAKRD